MNRDDGRSDPSVPRYAGETKGANRHRNMLIGFGLMVRAIDGEPGMAPLLKVLDK